MVKVKICGLTSERDVEACVEAGADAVGFIFAPSARQVSVAMAQRLTKLVPPFVTCVGVFAQNTATAVAAAVEHCRLDVLQFSGGEDPAFCGSFGRPTIVVIHARTGAHQTSQSSSSDSASLAPPVWPPSPCELVTARAIATMVDVAAGSSFGGTGKQMPMDVAARMRSMSPLPFVLAGGLLPNNVAAAIARVQPWAVDVRSGVERNGCKDRALVERFVRAARAAATREP